MHFVNLISSRATVRKWHLFKSSNYLRAASDRANTVFQMSSFDDTPSTVYFPEGCTHTTEPKAALECAMPNNIMEPFIDVNYPSSASKDDNYVLAYAKEVLSQKNLHLLCHFVNLISSRATVRKWHLFKSSNYLRAASDRANTVFQMSSFDDTPSTVYFPEGCTHTTEPKAALECAMPNNIMEPFIDVNYPSSASKDDNYVLAYAKEVLSLERRALDYSLWISKMPYEVTVSELSAVGGTSSHSLSLLFGNTIQWKLLTDFTP